MLRLKSQAIRRLGSPYICPSCLAKASNVDAIRLRPTIWIEQRSHHGRLFSNTSVRNAPALDEIPTTSPSSSESQAGKKKFVKKKKPNHQKSKAGPPNDGRSLDVLENALLALKKVLNTQQGGKQELRKDAENVKRTTPTAAARPSVRQKKAVPRPKKVSPNATQVKGQSELGKGEGGDENAQDPRVEHVLVRRVLSRASSPSNVASVNPIFKDTTPDGKSKSAKQPSPSANVKYEWRTQIAGRKGSIEKIEIEHIRAKDLLMKPIEKPQPPVPKLAYGLDKVLFNPGVYQLQDLRSKVYNFDPYLAKIMPIQEFDFNALQQYVTSSKDKSLISTAREHNMKYTGSTSSMTSMLSHFHYLLSSWRPINEGMMSKDFQSSSSNFTKIMRAPAAIFLHWKDGVYAIDADKEYDTANVLSMLGKSMEKLLTLPKEEYERYRHENSSQITEEERNAAEAYHYTSLGDFMMRSQLDAYDPRVGGTGTFDLKTRAVISIRMDAQGFEKGVGYELRRRHGSWESYEREYHDMIRAAFLKYSLQVRMGRMDGIFVAYHNTERIFGFQYVSLAEMDLALHGKEARYIGDDEFKLSIGLLNRILDRAAQKYPGQSLRVHFETRPSEVTPFMYIFAKPVAPGEIEEVQNTSKASVEAFESRILGLKKATVGSADFLAQEVISGGEVEKEQLFEKDGTQDSPREEGLETSSGVDDDATQDLGVDEHTADWEEIQQMVEEAMNDDEVGIGAVREAVEDALEESGLLEAQSPGEIRRHVDALLSAVTGDSIGFSSKSDTDYTESTGNSIDSFPDHESSHTKASDIGVEVETMSEVQDTSSSRNAPQQSEHSHFNMSTEAPEGDSDIAETDTASSTAGEFSNSESSMATAETDAGAFDGPHDIESDLVYDKGTKGDNAADSNMSILRSYILRMARKVDSKNSKSWQPLPDNSKLQEFERILERMIARSREDQGTEQVIGTGRLDGEAGFDDSSTSAQRASSTAGVDDGNPEAAPESGTIPKTDTKPTSNEDDQLLGMVLTIRNKVNGQYVTRPEKLLKTDAWTVEYNIEELKPGRAKTLYGQVKKRRKDILAGEGDRSAEWYSMFQGNLKTYSKKGRDFRLQQTELAKTRPVYVYGEEGARSYEEVFGRNQAK